MFIKNSWLFVLNYVISIPFTHCILSWRWGDYPFKSHQKAYLDAGFLNLSGRDVVQFLDVLDFVETLIQRGYVGHLARRQTLELMLIYLKVHLKDNDGSYMLEIAREGYYLVDSWERTLYDAIGDKINWKSLKGNSMSIKKVAVYLMNVFFALFVGYLYFGFAIEGLIILAVCVLLATYLAMLNHCKNKSKVAIFCLDLLLAFSVPVLFLSIIMGLDGVSNILNNDGPNMSVVASTALSFLICLMTGIYTLPAWLPCGIVNFFLLNKAVGKS